MDMNQYLFGITNVGSRCANVVAAAHISVAGAALIKAGGGFGDIQTCKWAIPLWMGES